ncbi:hypothetical protein GGR53DRAFT_485177 [Hypoxylon sp. FL1150]|nr:hypothetical protein GGR53DRAFT_485177 [Hypoxylon sp. FL1150]
MSKFAAYYDWTITAQKCLEGELPPQHLGEFWLWKGLIRFPLFGIEHSSRVESFYGELYSEVDRSNLDRKRKELYAKFKNRVVDAHIAVENQTRIGTNSRLRIPLAHLSAALKLMKELKEYDDENPVQWFEVFPDESVQCNLSPQELWLHFKLESLRPCLVFLVRLFRMILPGCSDLWDECERSLLRKEWIYQFILDSPKSPETPVPTHLLRRDGPSAR